MKKLLMSKTARVVKVVALGTMILAAGCAQLVTKEDYEGTDDASKLLLDFNAENCRLEAKAFSERFLNFNGAYNSCMVKKGYRLKNL